MKNYLIMGLVVSALSLSCATYVNVSVTTPPELNFGGAETVGVLPFATSQQDASAAIADEGIYSYYNYYAASELNDELKLASQLTSAVENLLAETDFFTIVSSDQLKTQAESGEITVDAIVTGKITNIIEDYEDGWEDVTRGDEVVSEYYYERSVMLNVDFRILDPATFAIIDSLSVTESVSDKDDSWDTTDSFDILLNKAIEEIIRDNRYQFIPRTRTESRFMKDLANPEDPRVETIKTQIQNGFLDEAKILYDEIYAESGDLAAQYNSIVLQEALGDLEGAIELLDAYARQTGDADATRTLRRMQDRLEAQNAMARE